MHLHDRLLKHFHDCVSAEPHESHMRWTGQGLAPFYGWENSKLESAMLEPELSSSNWNPKLFPRHLMADCLGVPLVHQFPEPPRRTLGGLQGALPGCCDFRQSCCVTYHTLPCGHWWPGPLPEGSP